MDSRAPVCRRCSNAHRKAYANFRDLIRSYLRGEITYQVMERCAGEIDLLHDMELAGCRNGAHVLR